MMYPSDETITPEPSAADLCSFGCLCWPNLSPKKRLKKGSSNGSAPPAILTVRVVDMFTIAGLTAAETSAIALPIFVNDSTDCADTSDAAPKESAGRQRLPHKAIPRTNIAAMRKEL